jgi:hypothetical protein
MDEVPTLTELSAAIADAKVKAETLAGYKRDLAAIVAERQTTIDQAQQEYDDAKIAMDRLQEQLRQVLSNVFPDSRVRLSK